MKFLIQRSHDLKYPIQIFLQEGSIIRDCGLFSKAEARELITHLQEIIQILESKIRE